MLRAERPASPCAQAGRVASAAGFTLIEVLVALVLTVVIVLAALAMLDASTRDHVRVLELSETEARGRVAVELFATDVTSSGFDSLGVWFDAVPRGTEYEIQLLSDLDSDGIVGVAGESDENITWEFLDGDGDGLYQLRRGVDLNGDGDFDDESESVEGIASGLVAIDADGDGLDDPFLAYDVPPPNVTRITITFGSRVTRDLVVREPNRVRRFVTEVALRNDPRGAR